MLSLDEIIRQPERVQELSEEEVIAMDYRLEAARAVLRRRLEVKFQPPVSNGHAARVEIEDQNLDVPAAAGILGVTPSYLYKHPKLPFFVTEGRRRLVSKVGLEAYMRKQRGQRPS